MCLEPINERLTPSANDLELVIQKQREDKQAQGGKGKWKWRL